MLTGTVQSPFLHLTSFTAEETPSAPPAFQPAGSPFVSVYELDGESTLDSGARDALATLVHELYDEEFDEALNELATEARGLHHQLLSSGASSADAERAVTHHFASLTRESERMIDSLAQRLGPHVQPGLEAQELASFVDEYAPATPLEPAFENFFGKLLKKVAKGVTAAAGAAVQAAKKLGVGAVLGKIKALLKPLLNKVLQKAIGKLPQPVQPLAQQLARKLGLVDASPVQDTASAPVAEMQGEFDQQLAEAFLSAGEGEWPVASSPATEPVFANLTEARELFTRQLEEGGNPEPHIQNFLPAVLPALRLGVRLIGRPKIVSFLSGLLTKFIANLIGPAQAPALSQAIVDSGLRLLSLEITAEQRNSLAASAVAATVEETVTRVTALPDEVFEDPELFEAFTLEAFESAAAANLPAIFSEAVYRQRPDLLEGGLNASWVSHPIAGPKRYKRCSRTFPVKLTPHLAEELESFDGVPLSEYLQDQLGLPENAEVEAEVHLFEALPGTALDDIARGESETPGLGTADEATLSQFHPLSPAAARALLGAHALGRRHANHAGRRHLAAGQRLYYLAIPGKRPGVRRLAHVSVTLDCVKNEVRACVYLSEAKAQRIATRLRQQSHTGSLAVAFSRLLHRRFHHLAERLAAGHPGRHLRLVHPSALPGPSLAAAWRKLPAQAVPALLSHLGAALPKAFAGFLRAESARFLAATENAADGVTLRFTLSHAPGLDAISQALSATRPAPAGDESKITVDIFPGHRCA